MGILKEATNTTMTRRVAMVSLGCAKNLVDGECLLGQLATGGYEIITDPAAADVIIINTCAFIEAAKKEAIDAILEQATWKEKGNCSCLVVSGCLAQRYASEIRESLPEVDLILGTCAISQICDQVDDFYAKQERRQALPEEQQREHDRALTRYYAPGALQHLDGPRLLSTGPSAYLKIAEGCSNRCAFCAIPRIRGPYQSRPLEAVLREAASLKEKGVNELILVAQDSTAYGLDRGEGRLLPKLLAELDDMDFQWIRFLYAYPSGFSSELLEVLAKSKHVLPYIDLPIQHASDRILAAMKREERQEDLRQIFQAIRRTVPQACLRTTVITGFPGETEEDLQCLLDFMQEIRFDHLGAFTFCPEEGTAAAQYAEQIPTALAEERQARIMLLQQEIARQKREETIGHQELLLIEGRTDDNLFYRARSWREAPDTDGLVAVASPVEMQLGNFYPVRIIEADAYERTGVYEP